MMFWQWKRLSVKRGRVKDEERACLLADFQLSSHGQAFPLDGLNPLRVAKPVNSKSKHIDRPPPDHVIIKLTTPSFSMPRQ